MVSTSRRRDGTIVPSMTIESFHPLVARWFRTRFAGPTAVQARGWQAIQSPDFYRELGLDPDSLVAAGVAAIRKRYGISND